ncbi:hypothetical protein [Campylobacter sp. JMF_08 NE1]|uniref:hypothetical protein n=1 Tax=Campylobacter sp. JMF_08 NE1 TaxID=2983821 RepID=UPI0022E99C1C|nr:hypothetical protein [Campylobacter sp. JMF_08 NE1]MDA3048224.1 hypothetical protein [Campylobacter sp. JMF_08 NE1]
MFQIINPNTKELTPLNTEEITTQIWEFIQYPQNHKILPILTKGLFLEMMNKPLLTAIPLEDNEIEEEWIPELILKKVLEVQEELNNLPQEQLTEQRILKAKVEIGKYIARHRINYIMAHHLKPQCMLGLETALEGIWVRQEAELREILPIEIVELTRDTSLPQVGELGRWVYRVGILWNWAMQLKTMGMLQDLQARNPYFSQSLSEKLAQALQWQELREMEILTLPQAKTMREMGNTDLEIFKAMGLSIYKEYLTMPQAVYPMSEIEARAFHY